MAAAQLLEESINCHLWQGGKDLGEGILTISEDFLQWKASRGDEEMKYSYPEISVHAISRDFDIFPHECLYILVIQEDTPDVIENGGKNGVGCMRLNALLIHWKIWDFSGHLLAQVGESNGHEVEEEEEGACEDSDGGTSLELRLVPEDVSKLNELYSTICYCQGLHPDPDLSEDDEEEVDEHLVAAMFGGQPSSAGELVVEEEENMEETAEGDGQFDDAD